MQYYKSIIPKLKVTSSRLKDALAHCCPRKLSSGAAGGLTTLLFSLCTPSHSRLWGTSFPHTAPALHDHRPCPLSLGPSPAPGAQAAGRGCTAARAVTCPAQPDLDGPGQLQGRGESSAAPTSARSDGGAGPAGAMLPLFSAPPAGPSRAGDGAKRGPNSGTHLRPRGHPPPQPPPTRARRSSASHPARARRADWQRRAPNGGQSPPEPRWVTAPNTNRRPEPSQLRGRAGPPPLIVWKQARMVAGTRLASWLAKQATNGSVRFLEGRGLAEAPSRSGTWRSPGNARPRGDVTCPRAAPHGCRDGAEGTREPLPAEPCPGQPPPGCSGTRSAAAGAYPL